MASSGAKTEILVDVETSPNIAVKSDYATIPEGVGGGRARLTSRAKLGTRAYFLSGPPFMK